jgi:hypothetical protein
MKIQATGTVGNVMSMQIGRRIKAARISVATALCVAFLGMAGGSAEARVFVGIGIPFYGPGYYAPPPVYYPPPPIYYAPPPVVYAPPRPYTSAPPGVGAGQVCYAGPYSCPMDNPVATGGSCYCLGNGGQRVWGRAN